MPRNQNPEYSPSQLRERRRLAALALMVVVIVIGAPAVYLFNYFNASNPTLLCAACHEMRASYLSWEKSLHNQTACDRCHVAPTVGVMLASKLKDPKRTLTKDDVLVPDEKCLDCHGDMPEEAFYHDIRVAHQKHIAEGVSCAVCHNRVSHGENVAEKEIPEVGTTCRNCHNDVRAASSCGVCHPGFREGKPSFATVDWEKGHHFNAEEQKNECVRCHSRSFCYGCHVTEAPHEAGFDHVKEFKDTNGELCNNCHDFGFCNDCHSIKKLHKSRAWNSAGHSKFEEKLATCEGSQCHSQKYCNECHEKNEDVEPLKDHDEKFQQTHPLFAAENTPECGRCHIDHFCISCHQGDIFHPEGWSNAHALRMNELAGGAEQTPDDRCSTCHSADFCAKCHNSEGLVQVTHEKNWDRTHKKATESKTNLCNACHAVGDCNECHEHKIVLPHDEKFIGDHKQETKQLREPCLLCHSQDFCISCHMAKKPETHNETWFNKHPKLTNRERQYCNQCHDEKQFCDLCHKSTVAKVSHVKGWDEKHPVKDMGELAGCARCHGFDSCALKCHNEIEREIAQKLEQGIELEKGQSGHLQCSKCHTDYLWTFGGIESCAACHEEISIGSGLSEKHHDCNVCHTPHTWEIASKNSCGECHEEQVKLVTVKEHKADNCSSCHYVEEHLWNPPAPFLKCFDCHLQEDKLPAELHNIGAHGRCGDCHAPHDVSVLLPDACAQCHKDLPPERCLAEKPCTECHAFKR
ncbi:MAG: NapC/NirT family cytochrome c [bacterium]